jgi:hypothetical protein
MRQSRPTCGFPVGWVEFHETHQLPGFVVGLAEFDPPYGQLGYGSPTNGSNLTTRRVCGGKSPNHVAFGQHAANWAVGFNRLVDCALRARCPGARSFFSFPPKFLAGVIPATREATFARHAWKASADVPPHFNARFFGRNRSLRVFVCGLRHLAGPAD